MKVSVILPAYQEADNLKNILPRIRKVMERLKENYEILVIDTVNPMDDTFSICKKNGAVYVSRKGGNSYGDAVRTGIAKAQGEYIVMMDADGSHNPEAILRFYREMQGGGYNLVIGSRYCKGGYSDNPVVLKTIYIVLNVAYRILFQIPVRDVSDSYRMYQAGKLKEICLICNNFDIVEEILIKLRYADSSFKVKEIPVSFHKRVNGKSKRNLLKFILSYILTMKHLLQLKKEICEGHKQIHE